MSGPGVWPEFPSASLTVLLVALRGSFCHSFFLLFCSLSLADLSLFILNARPAEGFCIPAVVLPSLSGWVGRHSVSPDNREMFVALHWSPISGVIYAFSLSPSLLPVPSHLSFCSLLLSSLSPFPFSSFTIRCSSSVVVVVVVVVIVVVVVSVAVDVVVLEFVVVDVVVVVALRMTRVHALLFLRGPDLLCMPVCSFSYTKYFR